MRYPESGSGDTHIQAFPGPGFRYHGSGIHNSLYGNHGGGSYRFSGPEIRVPASGLRIPEPGLLGPDSGSREPGIRDLDPGKRTPQTWILEPWPGAREHDSRKAQCRRGTSAIKAWHGGEGGLRLWTLTASQGDTAGGHPATAEGVHSHNAYTPHSTRSHLQG